MWKQMKKFFKSRDNRVIGALFGKKQGEDKKVFY